VAQEPLRSSARFRDALIASAVAAVTMGGEYFSRHHVLFWLPTFGSLIVNDMLSLLLAYTLLMLVCGLALGTHWRDELLGVWSSLQEAARTWEYIPWLLAIMLGLVVLPLVDRYLLGEVRVIPMITSSFHNPLALFVGLAPVLKVVALVSVNGLFVPIAEEYLWRGIVQVRLLSFLPAPAAIGITAVLFSFKHVLVDASFGRFITLILFGVICGIAARKKSWHASAAVHLLINTVTTVTGFAMGLQ
jgi:membrane protease YdiL (CAAX protease family)